MTIRQTLPTLALVAVSACSGAGGIGGTGTLPQSGAALDVAPRNERVAVRIVVPKRKHRRGEHYVSPATSSIAIVVTSGSATVLAKYFNVTPSSPGCSASPSGTLCVADVPLHGGSYDASVSAYDGLNGSGSVLSTASSIPFAVKTGKNNALAFTLSGVPAALTVLPADITSVQDANGAVDLAGQGAHRLIAEAVDADGNYIVGPGAPSFAITNTGGNANYTVAQPSSRTPDVFSVTPPTALVDGFTSATLTVKASYPSNESNGCVIAGAVCSGTATVDMRDLIAAPNEEQTATVDVGIFYGGSNEPIAQLTSETAPTYVTTTSAGDVAVYSGSTNTIDVYAPPYDKAAFARITATTSLPPAAGSGGVLLVAGSTSIKVYSPPYSGGPSTLSKSGKTPMQMAVDPSGNLFVAFSGGAIYESTPPYSSFSSSSFGVYGSTDQVSALAVDAQDDVLLYDASSGALAEKPHDSGQVALLASSDSVSALAFDAGGDLYIGYCSSCLSPSPSGQISEYQSFPNTWPGSPVETFAVSDPVEIVSDGEALYADTQNVQFILDEPFFEQFPNTGLPSAPSYSNSTGVYSSYGINTPVVSLGVSP